MKILMILTSHDKLGDTGHKTGFWLEEFAAPYYLFKDAGAEVTLASPLGGQPPLDPKSDETGAQTDATRRYWDDPAAQAALAETAKLWTLRASDFDAVFYPGGHGPLWDLAEDKSSIELIDTMIAAGQSRQWQAAGAGQTRDRLQQHRRASRRADRRGAVSGGRYAQNSGRQLQQGGRLAAPCRHRRAVDHWAEPGVFRASGSGAAGSAGCAANSSRSTGITRQSTVVRPDAV